MEWTEILIRVPTAHTDEAAAIANMIVPYGIYIEDYSDLEEGAREIAHIDLIDEELLKRDRTVTCIHVYINPQENPTESIAFLRERYAAVGIPSEVDAGTVNEQDWANQWKQYFKPLPIGDRLLICPTWEQVDNPDGRVVLSIDPGMAFGTGGHDTTRMVLEAMQPHLTADSDVLDVGCGSGILSIASLLLGAKTATGVDIDALAVKTALENGELNDMRAPRYTILKGDLVDKISGTYDVVLANIVADAIKLLSPAIPAFLKQDGIYIVSGIIDERGDEVCEALAACGFTVTERHEHGGWLCFVCRKD